MSMFNEVSKIHRRTGIFLLKITSTHPIMYGVFLADSPPGRDIMPNLLGGKCPAQVRVKQCFKFCPLPWSTFKGLFEGNNAKGVKRGLRITAEQTLDLITKFIIATRLVLSHRVISNLSGDIGKQIKQIDPNWVRDRLKLLRDSLEWQKKVVTGGALPFRFVPAFMAQCGTLDDFVWAVRCLDSGKEERNRTRFFHEDWKKFLFIIQELAILNCYVADVKGFANQMEDLMSILSQTSSPVGPQHAAIQAARCCSHRLPERSSVRTCHTPFVPQVDGPCLITRGQDCTTGYTNWDKLSQYGWQPQHHRSFNYPCKSNQYVFDMASLSSSLPEYVNNYDQFYKHRQAFPKVKKVNAPFVSYPPKFFTNCDLDEFQNGRWNRYDHHLEELTMRTEVSFCAQTMPPEIPPQRRHFTDLLDWRAPTYKQESFGRDFYNVKAWRKDDGLIGGLSRPIEKNLHN